MLPRDIDTAHRVLCSDSPGNVNLFIALSVDLGFFGRNQRNIEAFSIMNTARTHLRSDVDNEVNLRFAAFPEKGVVARERISRPK